MPRIQIKSIGGAVLHEGDYADTRAAVVAAVRSGAHLYGANLSGADLSGAHLRGAHLSRADLRGADLSGAHLYGAHLYGADLRGADLSGADLRGAHLRGADLRGADLVEGIAATDAPARRATRADGYEFFLWATSAGWRVAAGCRFFTMDEARCHWEQTRANTPLGDESLDILTMFELHIQRVGAAR